MIKKFIPSSLFIRFLLIIVLPTIFTQLIATYIFYNRHWYSVSRNMAHSLSNDIQVVYELQKTMNLVDLNKISNNLSLKVDVSKPIKNKKIIDSYPAETEHLYNLLKQYFTSPIKITFIENNDSIKIDIFQKNNIITFITHAKRIDNPTTYIFILWMSGTSLIFLLLSIIFTRNQIRPIIKLARAVDKFGKGQKMNLRPAGAYEVRKASLAFLKMKERIERQISHRTEMLAGISHDLRTPLTRMKLQVEMSKDSELKQIKEDIKDMEYMVNSYLDFARGDAKETANIINFNRFLHQILIPYSQKDLIIQNIARVKIPLKQDATKRCFQNILDNAFKYGNKVIINSFTKNDELYIEIHDNGSGIPFEKREDVFKPFFRLDESRNKDTGGVGLGLAITKDIISNHGGEISLESSPILKGLLVVIKLPL